MTRKIEIEGKSRQNVENKQTFDLYSDLYISDDSDDEAFGGFATKKAAPKKAKEPKKAVKKKSSFDDDSEDEEKPKKAKKAGKKASKFSDSGSGEEFDLSNVAPARDRPGRQKKTINYNFGGSDEDSDY